MEKKRELNRRKESNRAKYFIPNGKVEEYIQLVGEGKTFVNMFIAGNGVGKTAACANILTNIIYGIQNEWFDLPLFRKFPHLKRARIISDPTTIKEKIIPELEKWFPANESKRFPEANYETAKNSKPYISQFDTNTGWTIDIMSNEQDVKAFESVDLGLVWFDEPTSKDRFIATIARGRMGMIIIWSFTPLNYSAWIKDYMDEQLAIPPDSDGEKQLDYVEADVEANCKSHGTRGILEHKAIKRMVATYSEEEKQARAFGKFGHLVGRVHKGFNRKIHVIKPFAINEKDFTVYKAIDTHARVPDHIMWMAVARNGKKYICGELLSSGGAKLLHQRMLDFETVRKYRMEDNIIDPSAFNEDHHDDSDPSLGDALTDLGMTLHRGSKDLQAGIKRTDDALAYDLQNGEMITPPEFYIFESCPATIKQLDEYVWGEHKGTTADEKKKKGSPRDKDDHMPENLHRLLLHEPSFVPYDTRLHGNIVRTQQDNLDPYDR